MYNYMEFVWQQITQYAEQYIANRDADTNNDFTQQQFMQWLDWFESFMKVKTSEGIEKCYPGRKVTNIDFSHYVVDQKGICFLISIDSENDGALRTTHIAFYVSRFICDRLHYTQDKNVWTNKYMFISNSAPDPHIQEILGCPMATKFQTHELIYYSFITSLDAVVAEIINLLETGHIYQLEAAAPKQTIIDFMTGLTTT